MATAKLETTQVMEQAARECCAVINAWDIIVQTKFRPYCPDSDLLQRCDLSKS